MANENLSFKLITDNKNTFFTNNKFISAESLPVEGDFIKGDIIVNIGETADTEAMWVCIESGNPGVWEVVGAGVSNGNNNGGGSNNLVGLKNNVTLESDANEVEIGIEGFNKNNDMMTVYKNSVYMMEGKDYEFNEAGDRIVAMNGGVFKAGTVFGFVVLKEVPVVEEGEVIDGRVIEDGSIGLDKLDAEVKEAIEAAGNIDMSEYVSEEELEAKGYLTEHQDLSGYATKEELNELFQDVDSGKGIIADAIDDRNINKDSTFAAMGEAIEGIHADREEDRQKLIEILVGSNMELSGNESMDTLLDLIDMSNIDLSKVVQIDCSLNSSYMVKNDGTLWACGRNDYGQLGLGDTTNRTTFTQVEIDNVKYISCGGFHTFIIKNDGSVWSCGLNDTGQLGLGDTTNRNTFTQVTTNINNDVKQIACGYEIGSGGFTIIIKNDGSLWSCGRNNEGQLGLGNNTNKSSFTQVTSNINNDVKQIACGSLHTVILKNDGSVWSCGYNGKGQLGLSSYTAQNTFTQVTTNINNDVKQITCGGEHTLILKNDGSVLGAGSSSSYELASSTDSKPSFTLIANDVKKLGELSTGSSTTFIIKNDNSVWVRGHHYYGQAIVPGSPNAVRNFTEVEVLSNDEIEQIVNSAHTIILKADGSVWTCGLNNHGQLGIGNTTDSGLKAINEIEALKTQIQTLNTEATTNRGNLATVLTDEGVELTGDETLADLIVKTDEEFDRKNNEIENSGGGLDIISATELPNEVVNNQIVVITTNTPTDINVKDSSLCNPTTNGEMNIGVVTVPDDSGVPYNITQNNIMMSLYLKVAKERVNNVVNTLNGYTGIGGQWVQFSKSTFLVYDNGQDNYGISTSSNWSFANASFSLGTWNFAIYINGHGDNGWMDSSAWFTKKFDLTNYSTLKITGTKNSSATFGFSTSVGTTASMSKSFSLGTSSSEITVDISSLTGEYYLLVKGRSATTNYAAMSISRFELIP